MSDDIVDELRARDRKLWELAVGRGQSEIESRYPTLEKRAADEIERLRWEIWRLDGDVAPLKQEDNYE